MKKYIVHFTATEAGVQPPLETVGTPVVPIYETQFSNAAEARAFYNAELAAASTRGDIISRKELGYSPTEREDALHCSELELAALTYDEDGDLTDFEVIASQPLYVDE